MSKITVVDTASGYNLAAINSNFDTIATHLNTKVFYRDNPVGEPNSLQQDMDFNGKNLLNGGSASFSALTVNGESIDESIVAAEAAATAAAASATAAGVQAANSATSATQSASSASSAAASAAAAASVVTGALQASNNLSDLSNVATARANLGVTGTGANTFTGDQAVAKASPTLTLNDTGGTGVDTISFQKSGVQYWNWNYNSVSNAFALSRYNAGTLVDSPLVFANATGTATFAGGVVSNSANNAITGGSINNAVIGATTAAAGTFTTATASTVTVNTSLTGAGVTSRFSSPGPIGNTAPSTGNFTTLGLTGLLTSTTGAAFTSSVESTGGGYRMMLYNDGINAYLLQSASGGGWASPNSYRPLYWSLTTGAVNMDGTDAGWNVGPAPGFTGTNAARKHISYAGGCYFRNTSSTGGLWALMGPDFNNAILMFDQGSNGLYKTNGANVWSQTSDENLKNIRSDITSAVDKVNSLRTVMATWKEQDAYNEAYGLPDDAKQFPCVIAQDVEKILPEAITDVPLKVGFKGVQYDDLIPVALAAIKELSASLKAIDTRVSALEAK